MQPHPVHSNPLIAPVHLNPPLLVNAAKNKVEQLRHLHKPWVSTSIDTVNLESELVYHPNRTFVSNLLSMLMEGAMYAQVLTPPGFPQLDLCCAAPRGGYPYFKEGSK